MAYTPAMEAIERLRAKPLRQDILDLYVELRDLRKVADILQVSRNTLWSWRVRLDISDVDLQEVLLRQGEVGNTTGKKDLGIEIDEYRRPTTQGK